jgi:hypothetical protein
MELSDIYANRVKRNKITNLSIGSNFPQIQKDPTIAKLEKDVFLKLKNISDPDHINFKEITNINNTNVNSLSFEEALKELSNIQKNS